VQQAAVKVRAQQHRLAVGQGQAGRLNSAGAFTPKPANASAAEASAFGLGQRHRPSASRVRRLRDNVRDMIPSGGEAASKPRNPGANPRPRMAGNAGQGVPGPRRGHAAGAWSQPSLLRVFLLSLPTFRSLCHRHRRLRPLMAPLVTTIRDPISPTPSGPIRLSWLLLRPTGCLDRPAGWCALVNCWALAVVLRSQ